jgi:hypothetical protein
MKKIVFLALISAMPAGAIESGAQFLKIDTSARAVSMGSAYTALSDGINSIAYNPAGLSSAGGLELCFSHTNWLLDSTHDFIGVALPVAGMSRQPAAGPLVMGLALARLSNSAMEARNADRSAGGSFASYDQALSVGLARQAGRYRMGIGIKYVESVIAGISARAGAVDLGLSRDFRRLPVTVGLSVQNLGTKMRYISQKDPLPLTLAAGLAVNVIPGVSFVFDIRRLVYDREMGISFGTEYAVLSGFALRTGYMADNAGAKPAISGRNGFSAGAGLNFWSTRLDYSLTPYGDLGSAQKITLKKSF